MHGEGTGDVVRDKRAEMGGSEDINHFFVGQYEIDRVINCAGRP
jgi:hypothetical protein